MLSRCQNNLPLYRQLGKSLGSLGRLQSFSTEGSSGEDETAKASPEAVAAKNPLAAPLKRRAVPVRKEQKLATSPTKVPVPEPQQAPQRTRQPRVTASAAPARKTPAPMQDKDRSGSSIAKQLLTSSYTLLLPDPKDPSKTVARDTADLVVSPGNSLLNPMIKKLLRYLIPEQEMHKFLKGMMSRDEEERVLRKLETLVSTGGSGIEAPQLLAQLRQALNPDWSSISNPNRSMNGNKQTASAALADLQPPSAEYLDTFRAEYLALFGGSEEEFDAVKSSVAKKLGKDIRKLKQDLRAVNVIEQEKELKSIVAQIDADHPLKQRIESKVDVILANPMWPHDRKIVFTKRLVKAIQ